MDTAERSERAKVANSLIDPQVRHLRGRVAALARCVTNGERQPDDSDLAEARRALAILKLEQQIKAALAGGLVLIDEEVDRIIGLLSPTNSRREYFNHRAEQKAAEKVVQQR